MRTAKSRKQFDYERYAKEHGPDRSTLVRGSTQRSARRDAAKQRITIRLDDDVLGEFKALVTEGKGYQSLINQALRDWLAARGVKDLVRHELTKLVKQARATLSLAMR